MGGKGAIFLMTIDFYKKFPQKFPLLRCRGKVVNTYTTLDTNPVFFPLTGGSQKIS